MSSAEPIRSMNKPSPSVAGVISILDAGHGVRHIIGIGEMRISNQQGEILTTYSLGSCVGLSIYDPVAGIAGLIHCMLPLSKSNPEKAAECPYMYTDTGVSALLGAAYEMGAQPKRLIAKIAGCSQILDSAGHFEVGRRNHTICRKLLWKNGILIKNEDVGGSIPRTMSIHVTTGLTTIKSPDGERVI